MTARILQVTPYYPPFVDGQSHLVRSLAIALARRGWASEVLTSSSGASAGVSIHDGVIVRRLRRGDRATTAKMPMLLPHLLRLQSQRTVLHLHVGRAFSPEVAYLASRFRRLTFVAQLHGDLRPSSALGALLPLYKSEILSRIFRDASAVFVLDSDFGPILQSDYGYSGKLTIVRNGIADEWYEARPPSQSVLGHPLRLLYVGRLAVGKNLDALVDSLARLHGSVRLEIAGTGPEESHLRQQVARLGLSRYIQFSGQLSGRAIMARMQASHALILPSLYEGQPLSVLEAMAAGLPLICTNVLGLRGLVTGCAIVTGTSPEAIAAGIHQFMSLSTASIQAMVSRARERADNHRWDMVLHEYESAYRSALVRRQ